MKLKALLDEELAAPRLRENPEISGITADSRTVQPGSLFAALGGRREDGTRFVPEAIRNGAAAILLAEGSRPANVGAGVPVLTAAEPMEAFDAPRPAQ